MGNVSQDSRRRSCSDWCALTVLYNGAAEPTALAPSVTTSRGLTGQAAEWAGRCAEVWVRAAPSPPSSTLQARAIGGRPRLRHAAGENQVGTTSLNVLGQSGLQPDRPIRRWRGDGQQALTFVRDRTTRRSGDHPARIAEDGYRAGVDRAARLGPGVHWGLPRSSASRGLAQLVVMPPWPGLTRYAVDQAARNSYVLAGWRVGEAWTAGGCEWRARCSGRLSFVDGEAGITMDMIYARVMLWDCGGGTKSGVKPCTGLGRREH